MLYLPKLVPPTVLYSVHQDCLLLFCPTSSEIEPLLALEFLHKIADALDDFLGSPLLPSTIEENYDVVAQIVGEVCEAGMVCNTESNALRDTVEVPNWVGSLLGGIGLPSTSPSLANRNHSLGLQPGQGSGLTGSISNVSNTTVTGSAIPWRRSNVRHTSNKLYVDIVETLSVILAPSGRPLSAMVKGNIVFTSKMSGVPDLLLQLSAPGGKAGIQNAMESPSFHPCVRLARWRDRPGELSFVPSDGRFMLAGYESNLLPDLFTSTATQAETLNSNLTLPVSVEMQTCLGSYGDELEVRVTFPLSSSAREPVFASGTPLRGGNGVVKPSGASTHTSNGGTSSFVSGPGVENISITVPVPSIVRSVSDIRCSKGEANLVPSDAALEWYIPKREAANIGSAGATMRCTLVGPPEESNFQQVGSDGLGMHATAYDYDETADGLSKANQGNHRAITEKQIPQDTQQRPAAPKADMLMPQIAMVSFNVKGWLASSIKVDSLTVNTTASKGLGAGVTPYKGVKYHTVSRQGVEIRC